MSNTSNKKLTAAGIAFAVAAVAFILYYAVLLSKWDYPIGRLLTLERIAIPVSFILIAIYCLFLWRTLGTTIVYVLGIGLLGIVDLFIFAEMFLFPARKFIYFSSNLSYLYEYGIYFGVGVICFFLVIYKLKGKRPPLPLSITGGLLYTAFVLLYVIEIVKIISYVWFYIFIIVFEAATAVGLLILAYDSSHYTFANQLKRSMLYGGYQNPSFASLEEELKYLKNQYEMGYITAEEYELKRRSVLNKLN